MNNRLRIKKQISRPVITINDIAGHLGVSKTTVSRAISGKGRIGNETRDKVLAYIKEHGYQPNLIAKSLAVSKTFNIAVALPADTEVHEIPFFQTCLHSITETVTERDYDVVLSVTTGANISGLKRLLRNRKVDGVILTRLLSEDKAVALLKDAEMPFVVIGTSGDDSIIQIDSDHRAGCRTVMDHVLQVAGRGSAGSGIPGKESGRGKNILLAGNPEHQVNKDRYSGFTDALSERGAKVDEACVFWGMNDKAHIEKSMMAIMNKRPDFLVCMDDVICTGVLQWLRKNGFEVPSDVKIVSFHDSSNMAHHHPPVTALHIDVQELGRSAGNILLNLIEGHGVEQKNRIGFELLIRDSSRSL